MFNSKKEQKEPDVDSTAPNAAQAHDQVLPKVPEDDDPSVENIIDRDVIRDALEAQAAVEPPLRIATQAGDYIPVKTYHEVEQHIQGVANTQRDINTLYLVKTTRWAIALTADQAEAVADSVAEDMLATSAIKRYNIQ